MREIANERRWFDCWRLAILLGAREGMNLRKYSGYIAASG